jgi:hypothetical protein
LGFQSLRVTEGGGVPRAAPLHYLKAARRPDDKNVIVNAVPMRMNRYLAVIVALALGAVAPSAAAAQSPSGYRAQLNRVCRSYTPKLKRDSAKMRKAANARDAEAFGAALGHAIRLILTQDAYIENAPVPTAMRAEMKPILQLFRTADGHLRRAVRLGISHDVRGMLAEFNQVAKLTPSLNRRLDRAGLRDCGSNQT